MILIADSGSTKTQWRIVDDSGKISQERTLGMNPYLVSGEAMEVELSKSFLSHLTEKEISIYFYGSGCRSKKGKEMVRAAISTILPQATIIVEDDLLGAARATCNRTEGIVCILGTGSNSCAFDGSEIVSQVDSLGYILGDEGSGSYMGKFLLSDYLREQMPEDMREKMWKRYSLEREEILDKVYKESRPNMFLASFSTFILQNRKNSYIANLIMKSMNDFFEAHILLYDNHKSVPCHFSGSIAFYFADFVRKAARDHGILAKNIVEDPIAGLTLYHTNSQ